MRLSSSGLYSNAVTSHLNQIDQDAFANDGWLRVPQVLDREQIEDTKRALAGAIEINAARGNSSHVPMLDPNDSSVRVFNLIDLDPVFRDLITHPLADEVVRATVGDDFLISNFTANIARPGARPMQPHSDLAIVFPGPWLKPWSMNVIWCLDDVDEEVGATRYLPRSHLATSRDELPADLLIDMQPFEASAGDVILMDGRLWHTSGANTSTDRERALLFGYYSAGFLRPQVNWNAALSVETQRAVSPELRQRLGLNAAANVGHASYVARSP